MAGGVLAGAGRGTGRRAILGRPADGVRERATVRWRRGMSGDVGDVGGTEAGGFEPPPYPYDRLSDLRKLADELPGGCVDLSIGTPCDPPPPAVVEALARSGTERGYPTSIGSIAYREAAAGWLERRFGATVAPSQVAACIGTKELVAGVPQWLRLRT